MTQVASTGVPITFLQTSLDRKRRLVSRDDEGKGMRFREAEREAEWVGAEEQARQEQMPWPESMTGHAGVAAKLVGYADGFPLPARLRSSDRCRRRCAKPAWG